MEFEVKREIANDELKIKVDGVLDISTVDLFQNNVNLIKGIKKVTFDFENVKFIDSTGVGSLAKIIRECQRQNLSVKIYKINPAIFEVLDILGLPEIFGEETFEVN